MARSGRDHLYGAVVGRRVMADSFRLCAAARRNAANGSYRFTCGQPESSRGLGIKPLEELNPLFN